MIIKRERKRNRKRDEASKQLQLRDEKREKDTKLLSISW
jgi:hypothetical protein